MGVLRRISALATGLLVLQLALLGAAAPCTNHGIGGLAGASHEQSGHTGAANAAATTAGDHKDCDGAPAESGRSESSGGSCIAMISCVTPVLQLNPQLSVAGGLVITRIAAAPVLEPPTRTTAPELPPPRA